MSPLKIVGLVAIIAVVGIHFFFQRYTPEGGESKLSSLIFKDTNDMPFTLSSPVFEDGGAMPEKYTCEGAGVSPGLEISGAPDGTESFVLVMDDLDIPEAVKESMRIEKFNHWVLYNIPADTVTIPEGASLGSTGITTSGDAGYVPACPPDREHRYIYRLYALPGSLNFFKAPTLDEVEQAAKGSAIASTTLVGTYNKKENR